jgi:hypothetical protein
MSRKLKIHFITLFISTSCAFMLNCDSPDDSNDKKNQTTLLLSLLANNGTITCEEDVAATSYNNDASGFYFSFSSSSGTAIGGESNAIANRFIIISFKSQTTGTYSGSGSPADNYISIADGMTNTWYSNRAGGSVSITVTKYGAVGDKIEGTFSGTLKDSGGSGTLTLMNGKFSVRRDPDMSI